MGSDLTRDVYDRWAAVYESDDNPMITLEAPVLRELVPADLTGAHVLDLGCGTGRHLALFLERGAARVTGFDLSEGMLAKARGRADVRVQLVVHDLEQPLPAAGADVATTSLVLEHLRDLPRFFGHARAALRPGAVLVATAMHPAMYLRGTQAGYYDPASGQKVLTESFVHSAADIVNAIVGAGFEVQRLVERAADEALAQAHPRARKYLGWPMLLAVRAVAR